MRTCEVDGCDLPHKGHGMCRIHYEEAWRNERREHGPRCLVEGCDSPLKAKGLCSRHYTEARTGRPVRVVGQCRVSVCDRTPVAAGLCETHWQQRLDGVPALVPDRPTPCLGRDSEWFPDDPPTPEEAWAMCRDCHCVMACRDYAAITGQGAGVWGGQWLGAS